VVKPGDEITFGYLRIKAVQAYNSEQGNSTRKFHHKGDGVGYVITLDGKSYVITLDGKTIYHAGDTDFIPEMRRLGAIDVALLPIGGIFTMDIPEAIEAAIVIKPKIVIPMHRLKANPQEFKDRLEAKSDIKVAPLQIGETYHLV
jgi:L-ascorbate metabolism protein UlaG (beta-lactamase superfamily)